MPDYIHLMGSDDVSRAGHNMREAAQQMNSAASSIDSSLLQHQRFMEDWLQRYAALLEEHKTLP